MDANDDATFAPSQLQSAGGWRLVPKLPVLPTNQGSSYALCGLLQSTGPAILCAELVYNSANNSPAILESKDYESMRATAKATTSLDAEKQLQGFIDKFKPEHQALIRAMRKALRKRMPSATELVWDNYNFFVVGYSATERPSDSIVSIAAAANGVGLAFYRGATLPDPKKILLGLGAQNRFLRFESAKTLALSDVAALIDAAIAQAKTPLPAKGKGELIIRSISAKQKPRRKAAK